MPENEVVIKVVEPMPIASLRDVIADYASAGPLYEELFTEIGKSGIAPAGPMFGIYYDPGPKESNVDIEVAVPVADPSAKASGRVKVRVLEGMQQAVSLTRVGPYDDFSPAYEAIMNWVKSNGYQIIGPNREIYLTGPGQDVPPEQYVTEIQFPVEKAEG